MKSHSCYLLLFIVSALGMILSCNQNKYTDHKIVSLTQYVDPFIGSGGHGHVFVGANVPFGMVQAGPVQIGRAHV